MAVRKAYQTLKKRFDKLKWMNLMHFFLKLVLGVLTYIVGLIATLFEMLGDFAVVNVGAFGKDYLSGARAADMLMKENGMQAFQSKTVSSSLQSVLEFSVAATSTLVASMALDKLDMMPEGNSFFPFNILGNGGKIEIICFYLSLSLFSAVRTANNTLFVCACREVSFQGRDGGRERGREGGREAGR